MTLARKSCRVRLKAASLKIFTDVGMLGNVESENCGEDCEWHHATSSRFASRWREKNPWVRHLRMCVNVCRAGVSERAQVWDLLKD